MAFHIFKNELFPFPKPLILFYLFMVTVFFSPLRQIQFTSALSFNFTSFTSDDKNITYERSATTNDQVIQLTGDIRASKRLGRATYSSPMHLWDNTSRNLTDFTTQFSFVIDSQNTTDYGDGFAFFLAPNGSTIPPNTVDNHFVAVEFDIFPNIDPVTKLWDPPGVHVGIDVNSIISSANVSWEGSKISIMEGRINEARISYSSSSRNNNTVWQNLSYNVDLRDYLPGCETFGFSKHLQYVTTQI
jgi:hypothetical protein